MRTGEKIKRASSAATYGSEQRHQRRDAGSHSINTKVTGTSSAMEYLEIMPTPKQTPASHQARGCCAINARSRKNREAAQAAVSGASGVISKPERKKNGNACTS